MKDSLSTQQKALRVNLNQNIYGTFAEIGAGQEVAGNFLKAGAASGTIAKSISAYDMTFSDSIYGKEESILSKRLINYMNWLIDTSTLLPSIFGRKKFFLQNQKFLYVSDLLE